MDCDENFPQDEHSTETAQSQDDNYNSAIPDSDMNNEEEEIKDGDQLN